MDILKKEWRKIILAALLGVLVVWSGYYLIEKVPAFQISKISITGTKRCDLKKIEEFTNSTYGRCILKVNLSDLHRKIKSIGWVKRVSVRRILPNTLQIAIQERVPFGIIEADQRYLVDKEGVLIAPVQDQKVWDLPLITGLSGERFLMSRRIDSYSLNSALKVLKLMQDLKAQWLSGVFEISLENQENIVLYNKNRGREIRLGLNNLQEKVIYLQAIWNDINTRVSGIEYIDLRYKNQIIVKPEKHII